MQAESVVIERLVTGGRGLARQGSLVTFVRGGIPGERVTLTHTRRHGGYQLAELSSVLESAPERITPPCPVYHECGGCQIQHIQYHAQVRYKHDMLRETFHRIGKHTPQQIADPVPSPTLFHYRSWIRYSICRTSGTLGFRREGTHQIIEASQCQLPVKPLVPVIQCLCEHVQDAGKNICPFHQVELRHSLSQDTTLLIFRGAQIGKRHLREWESRLAHLPGVIGLIFSQSPEGQRHARRGSRWVMGAETLIEQFQGLSFPISDRSFMQAHWPMYETIGGVLMDWIQPEPRMRILELYAGIGCLGLLLARQGALVTLVEANPHALRDARKAAAMNHIGRSRFRLAKAEEYVAEMQRGEYDLLLLDPPRTGLSPSCVQAILNIQAPRILYLSCDAASLARDVARLTAKGYQVTRLQAFDMFPQTAHVEILAELVL